MKTYTEAQLNEILRNHKHWLMQDCEEWEYMRADLSRANLTGADLSWANLSGADLTRANLTRADLTEADLTGADLTRANLTGANLTRADLPGADLTGADLTWADLSWANLSGADLTRAYLTWADLTGADLSRANLTGAYLTMANLTRANLTKADLTGAKNIPYIPRACPDSGAFIAWKKAGGKIVKLLIPEDARRSSATGRKCRCDKAVVIAIENLDGTAPGIASVASNRDRNFIYTVGKTVSVPDFCEDRFQECADGIHFFINRQEAVEYSC